MSKNAGFGGATIFEPYFVENEEIEYICTIQNQFSQNSTLCLTDIRLFLYDEARNEFTILPIKSINTLSFSPKYFTLRALTGGSGGISAVANERTLEYLSELFTLLSQTVF